MKKETFELTAEHIKLLKRFQVGWQDCEFGAPEINPKRPYGNSSVELDIHEILTGEFVDDVDKLTGKQREKYRMLHFQTEMALQVVLATGKFQAGKYECEEYTAEWKLVK